MFNRGTVKGNFHSHRQNHHIRRANRTWLLLEPINVNCISIKDCYLLDQNRFQTHDEIVRTFGPILDFMTYNAIINSILQLWKIILKQRIIGEKNPVGLDKVPNVVKISNFVCWNNIKAMAKIRITIQLKLCGKLNLTRLSIIIHGTRL